MLANYGLKTKNIWQITLAAIALTIFNLFFPNFEPHNPSTIANRSIAVIALAVTGWLSIRNRYYEEAVARSQAQLRTQEPDCLTQVGESIDIWLKRRKGRVFMVS